eukprot:6460662-Amphidinium_carterae.1
MFRLVLSASLVAALLLASVLRVSYSSGYAAASPQWAPEPTSKTIYVRDQVRESARLVVNASLTHVGYRIIEIINLLGAEPNETSVTGDEIRSFRHLPVETPEHNTSSLGILGKNFLGRSTGSVFGRTGTLLSTSVLQDEVGKVQTPEVSVNSSSRTPTAAAQTAAL